ncbi:hypothetical protein PINS_up020998 [Pythium insidiosum]|nr:hypothetical protein PINS_up020998 [Pythium insidiosum]
MTPSETTATFLGRTKVKVLESFAEFTQAFVIADRDNVRHALESDAALSNHQESTRASTRLLCIELPPLPQDVSAADPQEMNVGVVFIHDRVESAVHLLQIPLLREPRGYFESSDVDAEEPCVFQDATVFSFNTKRESTEHGGGKTSEETIKNIRMRHASGTFCTLVYPTMTWTDVASKYAAALPHVRELRGGATVASVHGRRSQQPSGDSLAELSHGG